MRRISRKIEELGGDDWVFDQIASGVPMRVIAEPLGCDRAQIYRWRDLEPHREERRRRWKEARVQSSDAYLEDGEEILTDLASANVTPLASEVTLAVARAKYKSEMAKIFNPDYGSNGPTVNVNVGTLHLDALRQLGGHPKKALPAETIPEAEWEEAEE